MATNPIDLSCPIAVLAGRGSGIGCASAEPSRLGRGDVRFNRAGVSLLVCPTFQVRWPTGCGAVLTKG